MRIREVLAIGWIVSGGAIAACGSTSFESDVTDGGATSDASASTDGTIATDSPTGGGEGGGSSDGSIQHDGGAPPGPDAAVCAIPAGAIQVQTNDVYCGMALGCGTAANSTTPDCCITEAIGTGTCASGCGPGTVEWRCEKAADCPSGPATQCCLTGDAGPLDPMSCPARVPAASACVATGCGGGARMCTRRADCTDLGLGFVCRPTYATFGGNLDAGTMVGVCVPN